MSTTHSEILRQAAKTLENANCETPLLDARLLLQHALGCDHAEFIQVSDNEIVAEKKEVFSKSLLERVNGKPVHRIIGSREFYGLNFELSTATLEPRPDSEILVETIVSHLRRAGRLSDKLCFADLGTGTGALALSLLKELENSLGIATDISDEAANTCKRNAEMLGLSERLETRIGSWFTVIDEKLDFAVSNPPYIPSSDIRLLDRDVADYDPFLALDGGSDGLDAYRAILNEAPQNLKPNGFIVLEIGQDQGHAVRKLALENDLRLIDSQSDLNDIERCLVFSSSN